MDSNFVGVFDQTVFECSTVCRIAWCVPFCTRNWLKSKLCSAHPIRSTWRLDATAKNSVISPPCLSILKPLGLMP
jgi:hypothetical protein